MNDTLQFFAEFLVSRFFFIVLVFVGGLAFWTMARFVSLGTGLTREDAKEGIQDGNMAMALYFGLRVLAVGIAVGLFVLAGAVASQL